MYRYVIVEVYRAFGEASKNLYRARILPGQGWDVKMHIECSTRFRTEKNVGKLFKIQVQEKDTEMKRQLYSYFGWRVVPVSVEESAIFIAQNGVK